MFKKASLERYKSQATLAARLAKPIITPVLWIVCVVFVAAMNFLLYQMTHKTSPGFQGFFNFVFFLIVFFTFIGGYIRESIAKWLFTDLEKKLTNRLASIYYYKYNMPWPESVNLATKNVDEYTLESVLNYIRKEEK